MRELKHTLELGKVDANGTGRKINAVTIEIEVRHKTGDKRTVSLERINEWYELSMVGAVWNRTRTDWISGGQCKNEIARLFPDNPAVQRLVEIWNRWHLNDMNAGTSGQKQLIDFWWPIIKNQSWLSENYSGPTGAILSNMVGLEGYVEQVKAEFEVHKKRYDELVFRGDEDEPLTQAERDELELLYGPLQHLAVRVEFIDALLAEDGTLNKNPDRYTVSKCVLFFEDMLDVDGYRYGSAWLVEPLPDEVIEQIVSLIDILDGNGEDEEEERILPREYNFYQSGMTDVRAGWLPGSRTWTLKIGDYEFDYHTGPGLHDVEAADALRSLFDDAQYEDWTVDEMCDELGYEPDKAKRVLRQIKSNTSDLRRALGTHEFNRLAEIYND